MPKVKINAGGEWVPAVLADHEGAQYIFALPVKFIVGDRIYSRFILNYAVNSYHHIHTLAMPFLVAVNTSEIVSNSGAHGLDGNLEPLLHYHPDGSPIYVYGFYKLKQVIRFRKGYRPPANTCKNIKEPFLAWTVEEGLDRIWLLEPVPLPEGAVEIQLPEWGELQFQHLQGHLEAAPVEVGGNHEVLKRTKLVVYNHKFKQPVYNTPIVLPGVYRQPSWLVVTSWEVEVESRDHPTAKLQPGAYILYHPRPLVESGGVD